MSSSNCLLAVDAGGTYLKAVLMLAQNRPVTNSFFRIAVSSNGTADEIASAYQQLSSAAAQQAAQHGLVITAIGVCTPGPFDYENGISLMQHKYAAIYQTSLVPWLQHDLPAVPVSFLHDANSFLLGCLQDVRLRGCCRVAGVTLGTGLGFATYWDGKLNRTATGGPAITIYAQSFRSGTAEDYVSRRAILGDYAQLVGRCDDSLDVVDLAQQALQDADGPAATVFERMGTALGQLLVPVVVQNRLDAIVFGGAITKSWGLFAPALQRELAAANALLIAFDCPQIDLAPLYGVTAFALQQQGA